MFKNTISTTKPATTPIERNVGGSHWENALRLSALRALAMLSGLAALGLAYAGYEAWNTWEVTAVTVVIEAMALVAAVFAYTLWDHTDKVRDDLWAQEVAQGKDLNDDGVVGKPKKKRWLKVGQVNPVYLDMSDPEPDDEYPVYIEGFNASRDVVIAFFEYAGKFGLSRTNLCQEPKLILAKKEALTKPLWEHFMDQAEVRGWVQNGGQGRPYTWYPGITAEMVIKTLKEAK